MKKTDRLLLIAKSVLLIAVVMLVVNFFFYEFPDWLVRLTGIIMLVDLAVVSYLTVRQIRSE